mmetsp:Transcript_72/g.206  ORF Transcript_72/g.206 Transcript_72/m.206 type:complete len:122 (+) Transcript_72:481-846(+)
MHSSLLKKKLLIHSPVGLGVTLTNGGKDFSALERALATPILGAWNGYVNSFAFTEILVGARSRLGNRRKHPGDVSPFGPGTDAAAVAPPRPPSVIFAVGRPASGEADFPFGIETIATVELR